ncbi:hypothetical protein [Bradyrhizobium lablabi]|uniref:hypothetical protein n=1 Tax=Bradyrhizobium lablabi TaxID=722472 RepID=UPI001BA985F3|nr:hypothetical protein [Bradyrhizobium lablabi]MBR0697779.1 hypothetical protein [Bradyrhizobium lablabi]
MFKNLALSLISLQSATGYAYPGILDENGYPKSTPAANVFGEIQFASNLTPATPMLLKWTGTGSITLGRGAPGFSITSGSNFLSGGTDFNLNVVGTNVRVVFNFRTSVPSSVSFSFVAGGKFSNLSNVVLCRLSDEASIDKATTPEEMFDDNYVDVYRTLNPGIFRPMGWTNPNSGNVSQSRYIAPWRTAINLIDQRWAPGAWVGTTTGTDAYNCAAQKDATSTYVDGEMIQLQFGTANISRNVTVNSGGRGQVPILTGSGGALNVGQITANSLATLTYDALLGAFLWQPDGQTPCLPYELQIAFANRVNADYWCNFPSYMDDASVVSITKLVRDKLNSNLNGYFEYGNEVWNYGFPVTSWADAKGAALGFPSDNNRRHYGWYALRTRQIMGQVTSTWAPRQIAQLKRAMAFQAFGPASATSSFRMQGADLDGSTYPNYAGKGFANYKAAPNRPIDFCDVLSYATYYSGAQCTNFDANYLNLGASAIAGLLSAADDYATAVPSKMASALAFLDNDIRAGKTSKGAAGDQTLLALSSGANGGGIYPIWEAVAKTFNKPIVCYEGGHESWYPSTGACSSLGISVAYGGPTGKIANLLEAYKRSDAFAVLVRDQVSQFMAQPHSQAAAWLIVSGPNQWSLSTGDTYATKYKSWTAICALD